MELTQEQQQTASKALEQIRKTGAAAMVGGAGSGKTTVAIEILKQLPSDYSVTFLAFTNKACQVIEKKLLEQGLAVQYEVRTIHSFLKLTKQIIDPKTGARHFVQAQDEIEVIDDFAKHWLFIDEMGIIPNKREQPLAELLLCLENPQLHMGDECQLPPIDEPIGCLFEILKPDTFKLDSILRYGGALLEAAIRLRTEIKSPQAIFSLENNNDGSEGIFAVSQREIERRVKKFVLDDRFMRPEGADFFKVITWRNKSMDYWNALIRNLVFPEKANKERFIVGSRIVALETCTTKQIVVTAHSRYEKVVKLMSASEEGTIRSVLLGNCDYKPKEKIKEEVNLNYLRVWYLDVFTEYGSHVRLQVIYEEDVDKLNNVLKEFKYKKKWEIYWDIYDYFHQVKEAYSLTIMRLQGSTLNYAVTDLHDFTACKDIWLRNRMTYTAITRVRHAQIIPNSAI